MTLTDPHFIQKDPAARWRELAMHLRMHPEGFAVALENLARWEAGGRLHAAPLRQWRQLIGEAQSSADRLESLLAWMAEDNHHAEPLKSCSPFVGVLPQQAHASPA